jgi:hypothetical protein
MSSTKRSAEQVVMDALASHPGTTATEIAAATALGRSTVSKALANLERAGTARRSTGESATGHRPADKWSLSDDNPRSGRSGERLRPGQLDDLVLDLWGAHIRSQAAASYSWRSPPSRSRRRTDAARRLASSPAGRVVIGSGGRRPSARCGRCSLKWRT